MKRPHVLMSYRSGRHARAPRAWPPQTPPRVGTFQTSETYVADGASVAAPRSPSTDTTTGQFQVLFDNDATPLKADVEEHVIGTFAANGRTVDIAGDTPARFDLVNGTETDAGVTIRVALAYLHLRTCCGADAPARKLAG